MRKNQELTACFTIGRSVRLLQFMHVMHGFAILACGLNALPVVYRLVLMGLVLASWAYQHNNSKPKAIDLRYSDLGGWAICFDRQEYQEIDIKPTTVIGNILIILHYAIGYNSYSMVILNDAIPSGDYRRLNVLLKISRKSQEQ